MSEIEDKLDKIIELLEEIKANQPISYYPPIYQQPVIYPAIQPMEPYPATAPNESPWQPDYT